MLENISKNVKEKFKHFLFHPIKKKNCAYVSADGTLLY